MVPCCRYSLRMIWPSRISKTPLVATIWGGMTTALDTVGTLIDNAHNLRAYCCSCRHCVKLDLEALAIQLGRHHGSMHKKLVPKLRCSKCGEKNLALILSTEETEGVGHV
jgi:hypothetical protein